MASICFPKQHVLMKILFLPLDITDNCQNKWRTLKYRYFRKYGLVNGSPIQQHSHGPLIPIIFSLCPLLTQIGMPIMAKIQSLMKSVQVLVIIVFSYHIFSMGSYINVESLLTHCPHEPSSSCIRAYENIKFQ